jgi:hypothetical protein
MHAVLGVPGSCQWRRGIGTRRRRRSPADRQSRTSWRTRSRARRAPARPSPRLRRSPSARSCRPTPATGSPVSGCVDERAGRSACPSFPSSPVGFGDAAALAFLDEGGERRDSRRRVRGQRMLGGDGAEGHAHERVGARGEHPARRAPISVPARRGSSCGKAKRTPSLLPIQFACISARARASPAAGRAHRAAPRRRR